MKFVTEAFYSLSPANRWTDGKDESGVGTVPEGLHRP